MIENNIEILCCQDWMWPVQIESTRLVIDSAFDREAKKIKTKNTLYINLVFSLCQCYTRSFDVSIPTVYCIQHIITMYVLQTFDIQLYAKTKYCS